MPVIPVHRGKRVYGVHPDPTARAAWDVIVIGSGMGGMTCAAALAKHGRRVLVLEQHYLPGGFSHMFARKGFEWDVGVHAIGEMRPGDVPFKMLDWLTGKTSARIGDRLITIGETDGRFNIGHGFRINFVRLAPLAVLKFYIRLNSGIAHTPEELDRVRAMIAQYEAAKKEGTS